MRRSSDKLRSSPADIAGAGDKKTKFMNNRRSLKQYLPYMALTVTRRSEGTEHKLQRELIVVKIAPPNSESQFPIEWKEDMGRPRGLVNINHWLIQDAWVMCKFQLLADGVSEGDEMESYP